jgi:two-component system cell cycle sensor histidine kinase/response regulator CckA
MAIRVQDTISTDALWGSGGAAERIAFRQPVAAGGNLKTILLVDDNPGVREVAAELIRGAGYRVMEADSARAALAIAGKGEPIDLMIADIVMQGMRGTELGAEISRTRPALEILYVSGYPDEFEDEVKQQHRAAFLQKPFTAPALLTKIRNMLSRAESDAVTTR